MDDAIKEQLKYLRLPILLATWDEVIKAGTKKNPPYSQFLKEILLAEANNKTSMAKTQRRQKAKLPEN